MKTMDINTIAFALRFLKSNMADITDDLVSANGNINEPEIGALIDNFDELSDDMKDNEQLYLVVYHGEGDSPLSTLMSGKNAEEAFDKVAEYYCMGLDTVKDKVHLDHTVSLATLFTKQ
jgi:division protein CdvB (Snf7/Vps24/ESCRT-III family)